MDACVYLEDTACDCDDGRHRGRRGTDDTNGTSVDGSEQASQTSLNERSEFQQRMRNCQKATRARSLSRARALRIPSDSFRRRT